MTATTAPPLHRTGRAPRIRHGLVFSRARHRGTGPVQRVIERRWQSTMISLATLLLVITMFGSDPSLSPRA